jgi:hypothetical protein
MAAFQTRPIKVPKSVDSLDICRDISILIIKKAVERQDLVWLVEEKTEIFA